MIDHHLTAAQQQDRKSFRAFADAAIAPCADDFDRAEVMSLELIDELARRRYLGAQLPEEWGGTAMDPVSYGLLTEEFGRTCSSVRNLVAVQDMVAHAVFQWGTGEQQARWLPGITAGRTVAAFALTERGVGSDAKTVTTTAIETGTGYVLDGHKKWISFGEIAEVFLVFAQCDGAHTAFLVRRDTPGLTVTPIRGLLGLRGSQLAELTFAGCWIPADQLLGRPGTGLTFVATAALDLGRYSTAWGSVGLAQACLEASTQYAGAREQYGTQTGNHQLVQRMLADLRTGTMAARMLCYHAGVVRREGDPDAVNDTLVAKYHASRTAVQAAADAVQIHGAHGIGSEYPVQRYLRDAKVMEIIEGTTQIQQSIIGRYAGQAARYRHAVIPLHTERSMAGVQRLGG
jgi:alkylation response protein AidB-like acyl-CoA dehydrogenase